MASFIVDTRGRETTVQTEYRGTQYVVKFGQHGSRIRPEAVYRMGFECERPYFGKIAKESDTFINVSTQAGEAISQAPATCGWK